MATADITKEEMDAIFAGAFGVFQQDMVHMKAPDISFQDYMSFRDVALQFRFYCFRQFKAHNNNPPPNGYMDFAEFRFL